MALSRISWTDFTHNPWWGCARLSPGCAGCYADTTATRYGHKNLWRRKGPRRMLSDNHWRQPLKWNRDAAAAGQPSLVFCASMADVFEIHPVPEVNAQLDEARTRLWQLIADTPHLIWQLLTKRIDAVADLAPWGQDWPDNVWIGTSVEDQQRADERLGHLVDLPAAVRFVSAEPLLEQVDLSPWLAQPGRRGVDWLLVGGESGPAARPFDLAWAHALAEQAAASTTAYFFKQTGVLLARQLGLKGNGEDFTDQLPAALSHRSFPAVHAALIQRGSTEHGVLA